MTPVTRFSDFGISDAICSALQKHGYDTPTPVQAESIPILLARPRRDLVAQAQTGTGKTAAFGIPALNGVDVECNYPQVLVLTPTRELGLQVAAEIAKLGQNLKGLRVLAIYGGAPMTTQLRDLKSGAHIIVGTPGRIMDHIERGSLKLDKLRFLVLDEADDMLRMGFIDDVEWILKHVPSEHQTALFSATMPPSIRKIAQKYLKNPGEVQIKAKTRTVEAIEQSYTMVSQPQKMDALIRFLEVETIDAAIVFTRTIIESLNVADKLAARGIKVSALNGEMKQSQRENVMKGLKDGRLNVVVATEVAARGLDVSRISHVINYDIPMDSESYVHRVGRTGRAGREGKALMLVTPKERYLLKQFERELNQTFTAIEPPTAAEVNKITEQKFATLLQNVIQKQDLGFHREMIERLVQEQGCSAVDLAAALAYLSQKAMPAKELSTSAPQYDNDRAPAKKPFNRKITFKPSSSGGGGRTFSKAAPNRRRGERSGAR